MKKRSVILRYVCLLFALCFMLQSCDSVLDPIDESSSSLESVPKENTTEEPKPKAVNTVTQAPKDALYQNGETYYVVSPSDLPNNGELFVDHSEERRGGHFGHAMVEYADGKILCFYPNCNGDNNGHSGRGWMEYKRSEDYGKTWSESFILDYSYETFQNSNEKRSVMCEKSVVADDGTIILFCLQCDVDETALWEPYYQPVYLTSSDGGVTWSEPKLFSDKNGRVYDVLKYRDAIYVLAHLTDPKDGKIYYYLFTTKDNGLTFEEKKNKLPFHTACFYGTMEVLPDDSLIVYAYSEEDETRLYYSISETNGLYWSNVSTASFEKCIRNPQMIQLNGSYFIMGRSGQKTGNNVIYFSKDGINWDAGNYLSIRDTGIGAYSNAIVVGTFNNDMPNRVLYQASKAYYKNLTNIYHWWIDAYVVVSEET